MPTDLNLRSVHNIFKDQGQNTSPSDIDVCSTRLTCQADFQNRIINADYTFLDIAIGTYDSTAALMMPLRYSMTAWPTSICSAKFTMCCFGEWSICM